MHAFMYICMYACIWYRHVHNATQLLSEAVQANIKRESDRQQALDDLAALQQQRHALQQEEHALQQQQKEPKLDNGAEPQMQLQQELQQDELDAGLLQHADTEVLQQTHPEQKRVSEYNEEPP